jgi:RNA polymerase sigma-70 factor (ECF subfamily)
MLMATLTAHPRKASPLRSRSPGTLEDSAIIGSLRIDRDEDLVTGLRGRDREAAEILVARYGDRLYRLAIRITGSESDAEEVVQDALWTATRKIDTFRGDSSLGTWLHRIAVNAAIQKRRTQRRRRTEVSRDVMFPPLTGQEQQGEPAPDGSRRMEDPALQMELRSMLTSAIADLREGHCTSFLLHDLEGLSNHEISALLRVKVGTVKSRVHRARLFLRSRLAGYMSGELGDGPDGSANPSS